MKHDIPTPAMLRLLLTFEGETGKLFWNERTPDMFDDGARTAEQICNWWNSRYAHTEAFTALSVKGFKTGTIFGDHYRAHRVIWCMAIGRWPDEELIHRNRNKLDNRIRNLMEMTHLQSIRRSVRDKQMKTSHRRSA